MNIDYRAIVQCLLTAHYTEFEVVEYLEHVLGLAPEAAARSVRDVAGGSHRR